jgi:hypothetical protein
MSEMIKRVADAMQVAGDKWVNEGHADWRDIDLKVLARAAIEALREPTKAMVAASNPHPAEQEIAIFAWQAMIDAALSPDKQ